MLSCMEQHDRIETRLLFFYFEKIQLKYFSYFISKHIINLVIIISYIMSSFQRNRDGGHLYSLLWLGLERVLT